MTGMVMSCQVKDGELGEDLLPPGDNVFLFHDTIFDIQAYPVTGEPVITSDRTLNRDKLYIIGYCQDTIVGSSLASVVTHFNPTSTFRTGPNTEIDTLFLGLYFDDYVGDMSEEVTVRIHEMNERIYSDSTYYSNYEVEGKYNPVPLAEKSFLPENGITQEFMIKDQDFINKFLDVQTDTAIFRSDSLFKDYFNGLYITAEPASSKGVMARIGLSNISTRLSMKYANDSTEVDSTAGRDFVWAHFTINEFTSQKINVFKHDYSGTYLSSIIDSEDAETPYLYVQGMSGVNTRLTFTNLSEWMLEEPIAINSATLIFDVVPEEESGIMYEDLPERLMLFTDRDEEENEPLYDYMAVYQTDDRLFGGILKADSKGMFFDTTYSYRFNMGLHFQAMISGDKPDNNFILQLYTALINPNFSKLYSNLPANRKRIRLEIVYLKL